MIRSGFIALTAALFTVAAIAQADDKLWLPTGQSVSPTAAPGAIFQPLTVDLPIVGKQIANSGVTSVLSADGHTLFVLTSGFNTWRDANGKKIPEASTEHLFAYDVTQGTPKLTQDLHVPNSYSGLVPSADGQTLLVPGGMDDNVHFYHQSPDGDWVEAGTPVALGHMSGNGLIKNPAVLKPMAAGAALSADGKTLVVANYENDSIDIVDVTTRKIVKELDLRPGKSDPKNVGMPGGEFPYWVAIKGNDTAYISSERDREVVVVALDAGPSVTARIEVEGNPNRMILDRAEARLFVASDNADRVTIINTSTNKVATSFGVGVPRGYGPNAHLPGAAPNALALSPDEKTLYVSEGGINAVGVVRLDGTPQLVGLIPTAWQPSSVTLSADGKTLYVVNAKSPAGPNRHNCMKTSATDPMCSASDQLGASNGYVWQHITGGLTTIPVPDADVLERLTAIVAENNGYRETMSPADTKLMAELRKRIKHVIYIVKENRTYDQILGDLPGTDGDPAILQFGPNVTANEHALARQFVALDAFFDSGEASGNGWQWSTAARTSDVTEKEMPVNYSDRGASYDFEGATRDVNVSMPLADRPKFNPVIDRDPDLLPGPSNQAALDGPDGEREQGYLWDAVLRAHKTLRNYGFFVDISRYISQMPPSAYIPPLHDPFAKHVPVSPTMDRDIAPYTDVYFRGFDNALADFWRFKEWNREFTGFEKNGKLPALETVRFMHDHTGDFKEAIDGVNTPETQIADNDYAVGLLVDRVAHSKYASSTLIFVIEDDAQDGPDHVDAHRSIAFIAGPYVRHHAVVSDHYTTVNMVRTMEVILGLKPLNFHDANARPMTTVFDLKQSRWTYNALVPEMLRTTQLPLPPERKRADAVRPLHDAIYWARVTKGMDFSAEDKLDAGAYDRVLWTGTMGNAPYPARRDGMSRRATAR